MKGATDKERERESVRGSEGLNERDGEGERERGGGRGGGRGWREKEG